MNALPRILVVDDEETVRNTFQELLSSEEIELLFAENGRRALELAEAFQPDAILLDVMMPEMDGYEVCRRIRATPALSEIPILMITALDDRNSRLVGLVAGADDFVTKPFDGFELQIRVRNIVQINRYRSLLAERSRLHWVIDNDEKGYLILGPQGDIEYANVCAQTYFHLPERYAGINFDRQAARYYQMHMLETESAEIATDVSVAYLVQPESETARAFWLRVEALQSSAWDKKQRLLRVTDVTDKMSAYQDIRKFHLTVAHKLRTPVSLIYSAMNLLDTRIDLLPQHEIKPMIHNAWKNAERLTAEVQEILKYVNAPLALTDGKSLVCGEIEGMLKLACSELEIEALTVSLPVALANFKIKISNRAMELIAYELLENSKKFHPQHTPRIEALIEAQGERYVQIQFVDDGHSMTAEQIARAQMPYFQGEKWFTGETPGMGLGVPLVATLVWQAGGYLRLENREDRPGVCVTLTLPILPD